MADDLGGRLLAAGLVTRAQLSEVHERGPRHDGALVAGLTAEGLSEDGLAGFFIALGYGPLMEPADLSAADPPALARVSASMAADLLVLPIRDTDSGLVIAMAAPTDTPSLDALREATGAAVHPAVARVSDLHEAIERAYVSTTGPVLELVNVRRPGRPPPPEGYFGSTHGAERVEARATVRQRDDDEEGFVPLVRHKAVRHEAVRHEAVPTKPARGPSPSRLRDKVVTETFEQLPRTDSPRVVPVGKPKPRAEPRVPEGLAHQDTEIDLEIEVDVEVEPRSIIPLEHAHWDLEPAPNKLDAEVAKSVRRPPPKTPPRMPRIEPTLARIRETESRDEIVEIACEGVLTVARASVLLALRKSVLKGWGGAGAGVSDTAVRNLWIPTSSPSMFREVVARKEPYHGPPGTAAADGLFRATLGSRGGAVTLQPILVGTKLVAVLAADDLRFGDEGAARVETLARAVSEAFERVIRSKRRS